MRRIRENIGNINEVVKYRNIYSFLWIFPLFLFLVTNYFTSVTADQKALSIHITIVTTYLLSVITAVVTIVFLFKTLGRIYIRLFTWSIFLVYVAGYVFATPFIAIISVIIFAILLLDSNKVLSREAGRDTNISEGDARKGIQKSRGVSFWGNFLIFGGVGYGIINAARNIWRFDYVTLPPLFVIVGIGVLALKNWARRITIIYMGLMLLFGSFFLPGVPEQINQMFAEPAWKITVFLTMFIRFVVCVAGLIFFCDPTVKRQFQKRGNV